MPPEIIPESLRAELLEGMKYDDDKVRMDLLSPVFIEGTAKVLTFGAKKYDAYNWAKGIHYSRVFAAMQRHLWAFWGGEDADDETGMPHLWHAACCLMFLMHYEELGPDGFDDRP